MSNIDINLIRARDGAAPQHKASNANKFELSEGSDGAQHVKIVDSEGNVQDKISVELPDKQIVTVDNQIQLPTDYPDKAVEARLQAIEQTQSQILDKLNDTIDTRLTGSIEEDEVFSRAIINNASVTRFIRPRPGVREVAIYARIYSSTGVFESGQGLSIAVTPRYDANRTFGIINTGKTNGNNRGIAIYIGKGYSDWKDDNVSSVLPRQYHINSGIAPLYGFQLMADGSFESGEGIDCDLQVQWIY